MKITSENICSPLSQRGFTLLEVLIAMVILSIGLLGLASLTGTVIRSNAFSDKFTTATVLAQDKLEELANRSYSDANLTDSVVVNNNWGGVDPWMLSTGAGNFENQENVNDDGTVGAGGFFTRTWNIWTRTDLAVPPARKDIVVVVTWQNSYGITKSVSVATVKTNSG